MVENYEFFNIPRSCEVKNTIFKKFFYENADISSADRTLFIDVINKITWLYCLKPDIINIQPYKDGIREYNEVEYIEVDLSEDRRVNRIAEIIMRTIPYPMVLIFRLNNKFQLYVAHQRTNLNDSSKNTIEELISTQWVESNSNLFGTLNIQKMRFSNFYAFYCDIIDVISIYNASVLISINPDISGEEARSLAAEIEGLNKEIALLKTKLKNETQFNKKIGLNIEIRNLSKRQSQLTGGNKNAGNQFERSKS